MHGSAATVVSVASFIEPPKSLFPPEMETLSSTKPSETVMSIAPDEPSGLSASDVPHDEL